MDVPFLDLAAGTADVRQDIERRWADLLDSSRFVGGEVVERFEARWADYCGTTDGIGVANGTDALHLVLRGLGIGAGCEVIVPANSFVATAEAVVLAGAVPRFADVDPDTLLITADTATAALTPRTAAIIAVHLYGQPADMDALRRVATRHGLALLEDAAQAHGARWLGRPAGSLGDAGCFSFYPGKNLGAFGDAGAVVTSDRQLADRIRALRDHGRAAGSHHDHASIGTNSRLDGLQAVVLDVKLDHLARWNEARRAIAARYRAALDGTAIRPVAEAAGAYGVEHLAVVRTTERTRVRHWLRTRGVETAIHYLTPIHLLEPYQRYSADPLPVVEGTAAQVLSLPMFPQLTDTQADQVCGALEAAAAQLGGREAVGV